jgi:hypothetical protein
VRRGGSGDGEEGGGGAGAVRAVAHGDGGAAAVPSVGLAPTVVVVYNQG